MLAALVFAILGKAQFWWIIVAWVYFGIIARRDKRDRKSYKKILRQEARKKHTKYVPMDTSNVVYLSRYRKKKQIPTA
jgi:hypothetical protein